MRLYFTLIIVSFLLLIPLQSCAASFSDVPSSDPDYAAINYVGEQGIATGTGNGKFEPDLYLTRAESTKFIARTVELACNSYNESEPDFTDTAQAYGLKPYIACLEAKGFVSGYGDGTFGPQNPVLFHEFLKMLYRAGGIEVDLEHTPIYADLSDRSVTPYVAKAISEHVYPAAVNNYVNTGRSMQRRDVARIIYLFAQARASTGTSSVRITQVATKIAQLIGDYDKERQIPTANLTDTRYKIYGTDLGVPFQHNNKTYLLFGDTIGPLGGDTLAYTEDTNPEDGLDLTFMSNPVTDTYRPIMIPGLSQADFEVPMEGVSVNDKMYIYHTTGHAEPVKFNKSVVAVSADDGKTFNYLYDFSVQNFLNVSIVETDSSKWTGLPQDEGMGLVMFGSGEYRQSNVYLAYQPQNEIENPSAIRYFTGLNASNEPTWSNKESEAKELFNQACVGELSVTYNEFIDKWIMLYNCELPKSKGINMRTADQPWGPWSEPQILFEAWRDNGYCHFIHVSWLNQRCDNVQDSERPNEWGGTYGPYQFANLATGDNSSTTIYFTLSTWNPYTVGLMKARLEKE